MKDEESWITKYWRPAMAWQYTAVCLFDFMLAPMLTAIYYKWAGGTYVPWIPITLKEGGFYHMSMMAIVGISAYTRGQEKITKMMYGPELPETPTEK